MRVDLDADVAELIQRRVDDGRYADATAVIREALQLQEEREKHKYVRAALAKAIAQADQGDEVEWTPDLMDRLVEESEEMYRQGIKPHPDVCP
jgi:putative addiction module CopG family antidote